MYTVSGAFSIYFLEKFFLREIGQKYLQYVLVNMQPETPLCDFDYPSPLQLQPEVPVEKNLVLLRGAFGFDSGPAPGPPASKMHDLTLRLIFVDNLMDG